VFNQFGDLERSALRPKNLHSADGWCDVLEPELAPWSMTTLRDGLVKIGAKKMPG